MTDEQEVAWGKHEAAGCLEKKKKRKRKNGLLPWALVWAKMGLVSKEWAWVEGNGLKRCKGAE